MIFSGQVLSAIISIASVKILTQLLSPEKYGELALGLTFIVLLNNLLFGPFSNAFQRFYSVFKEKNQLRIFSALLHNEITRLVFFTALIGIFTLSILFVFKNSLFLFGALAVLFALLSGINSIFDGIQNAARQRIIVVFHQLSLNLLKVLLAVIFILIFSAKAFYALLGYLSAGVLVVFSQKFFLRKLFIPNERDVIIDRESISKIRNYAYPFMYWGIFTFLHLVSDKWAIQFFDNIDNVGNYAVLYQLGYSPIILLTTILVKLIAPIFYEKAGDATDFERMKIVRKYNTFLIAICLFITFSAFGLTHFLHETIFRLLVSKDYSSCSFLLPFVVLAAGLFATGQVATIYQLSSNSTSRLIKVKICTSSIGLLLNFAGAYYYGINGVIYSLLSFSIIYFLWIIFLSYNSALSHDSFENRP